MWHRFTFGTLVLLLTAGLALAGPNPTTPDYSSQRASPSRELKFPLLDGLDLSAKQARAIQMILRETRLKIQLVRQDKSLSQHEKLRRLQGLHFSRTRGIMHLLTPPQASIFRRNIQANYDRLRAQKRNT